MKHRLLALDLDGTLVPASSVNHAVARELGLVREFAIVERDYASGVIDNRAAARSLAPHLHGVSVRNFLEMVDEVPLLEDAGSVCASLADNGVETLLASVTWRLAADHIAGRLRTQAICGVELEVCSGRFTGRVLKAIDEFDKRDAVVNYARRQGVSASRCAAIGDSRSDLPLFRAVGMACALNAEETARASADEVVDGMCLADAVAALTKPPRYQRCGV